MVTALNTSLRRELPIRGHPYVLTISPRGLKLVLKGKRNGYEVSWDSLVSGGAALAAALNASLEAPIVPKKPAKAAPKAARPRKARRKKSLR